MEVPRIKYSNIEDYIASFPVEVQNILKKIRSVISKAAPGAIEKMSYGMPTFYLNGNLVHFAAYKNHIGFYPAPSGIKAFNEELIDYEWSKGSVQFPLSKPVPFELIEKIVKFRVNENQAKS